MNSSSEIQRVDRFRTLLERYRPLKTENAAFEQREALDFNLFELFRLQRQEWVHSAFLKDLLDPTGSHAQSDLFLRGFLEHCQSRYPQFPNLLEVWATEASAPRVYAEVPTGLGRPDLLILLERKFALVIENKIDAPEGPDQIERYRDWLGNQPEAETGEIALLYLTPCPLTFETSLPDKCFPLSYRDDITTWIERCVHEKGLGSAGVQSSLKQYLKVIRGLCTEAAMSNRNEQSPLGNFVRENRQDIFDLWQAFKREFEDPRGLFWTKLVERVRQGLASRTSGSWKVWLKSEDPVQLSKRDGGMLFVGVSDLDRDLLRCQFLVQEYSGRLEYGIAWTEAVTPQKEKKILEVSKELVSLRRDLEKQDFGRHRWWVALKRADLDLDETRVVADLYSGERFQRLWAEKLLDLFDQGASRVRKINETLAKENLKSGR